MRLAASLIVIACSVGYGRCLSGGEQAPWPHRVLQAAQYLTGKWDVEGTLGAEHWKGEWMCQWVPSQGVYYISCSGAHLGGDEPPQRLTLLRGQGLGSGPVPGADFPIQPKGASGSGTSTRLTTAVSPAATGPVRVTRNGPDEFVWEATTGRGRALTLMFRRAGATTPPKRQGDDSREEVPARSVDAS